MSTGHDTGTGDGVTLAVDMVRCAGHGICAFVFPERVSLDEWGFAHVDAAPVTDRRGVRRAHRAERACPRRALLLSPAATAQNAATPANRMAASATRPTV